jgi:uncharacterized membrane protein
MILVPQLLTDLADPWAKLYSHSNLLATIVGFLHVAPIVVGGGMAIALDRATLRVSRDDVGARSRHLAELASAHRVVIGSLLLSILSGIALLAADLETFFGSWIFWAKMALIGVLLVNGALMTRSERAIAAAGPSTDAQWNRLRTNAFTSLALWLIITFAGMALMNLA